MTTNNQILEEEKKHIDLLMRENVKLQNENENNQIVVTQTFSMYLFLAFVVFVLVCIIIRVSVSTGEQRGGGKGMNKRFLNESLFLLGVIVLFMIVSFFLRPLHI